LWEFDYHLIQLCSSNLNPKGIDSHTSGSDFKQRGEKKLKQLKKLHREKELQASGFRTSVG
jgi:hypothetical protein